MLCVYFCTDYRILVCNIAEVRFPLVFPWLMNLLPSTFTYASSAGFDVHAPTIAAMHMIKSVFFISSSLTVINGYKYK